MLIKANINVYISIKLEKLRRNNGLFNRCLYEFSAYYYYKFAINVCDIALALFPLKSQFILLTNPSDLFN